MGWISRFMMGGVGAFFAGIFFGLKDLGPYLNAARTGVVVRRGYNAVKIARDEDPARFATLVASRRKGVFYGFGLSAAGAATAVICFILMMAITKARF
ncbi:MAG TPA: hypothetical protein VG407_15100 [Caulobacteraceae bacterium]|jgi:hypothetical protein|nr:hypothetical protein [Caulobacteraceae bacterium]